MIQTITEDLHGSATESFWISASFLLAMCISQPIVSNLSTCVKRKSLILSSFLIWGLGSITVDYAAGIVFCLVGRSVQGLGAGGLLVLTYVAYGDLKKHNIADKYLRAITCSAAVGTISGPFIGASLSHKSSWVRSHRVFEI
jgi:MFS family permease